jgi:hypothetical protein
MRFRRHWMLLQETRTKKSKEKAAALHNGQNTACSLCGFALWQSRMAGVWKLNHRLVSVRAGFIFILLTSFVWSVKTHPRCQQRIIPLTLICVSQCGLAAKSCVLLCSLSNYLTSTIRTRHAQLIDIADSRGFWLTTISTSYSYPFNPRLNWFYSKIDWPPTLVKNLPPKLLALPQHNLSILQGCLHTVSHHFVIALERHMQNRNGA